MTPDEQRLYDIYAAWTGQLNFWCRTKLGRHLDCEFFPTNWEFAIYSGRARDSVVWVAGFGTGATTPGLERPEGERREVLKLPRPEDRPTQEQLDDAFKALCVAAARVLRIDLKRALLPDSPNESDNPLRPGLGSGEGQAGALPALHERKRRPAKGAQKTQPKLPPAGRTRDPEKPH